MADILRGITLRTTPQSEQADSRQVPTSAGGWAFAITDTARVRRFLLLGSEGTYYAGARELTAENAAVVLDFAREHTLELVVEILELSVAGRAPKQNPLLFALAAAASLGDLDGRRAALAALPVVARTGTQLFTFVGYCEQFRGWGRGLRRAVAHWYLVKPVADVAYQAVKYRSRT